jgi:hypothetical protein
MGIELELFVLLVCSIVGQSTFARFAIEVPVWQKITKWLVLTALTLGLYGIAGHYALLLPLVLATAGMAVHFAWCHTHGIDAVNATPTRKYYALRGWHWPATQD